MYNVLFHIILLAYLLATLLFWLAMGLRQRWLFHLASGLLGGGFGLQTAVLGYRLSMQMFLWWGDVALPYRSVGSIHCAARLPGCGVCRHAGDHTGAVATGGTACVAGLAYWARAARLCGAYPDVLYWGDVPHSGTPTEVETSRGLVSPLTVAYAA